MELSDEMLKEISYVKISTYRTKVMKSLDGDVKIPSVIAKDSGIKTNHISKVLSELKAHELVECINPEVRKGRLYRLTDKGETVTENIIID
ncbi:MAG: transcriptional regulator [Methanobrevibacter sp.]|nr:transcriptional regulator [Methanobrevibacter sp.]